MSDWLSGLKGFLSGILGAKQRDGSSEKENRSRKKEREQVAEEKSVVAKLANRKTKALEPTGRPKQATSGTKQRTPNLIVVGLDFGTAYTKCVVRDAFVRDPGKAYPVSFRLADGDSYLVPS